MAEEKYTLIIADDESAIRRGMCNYINWADMGFSVAADFEDGKETIEYLEKNRVDVVLTDIRMAEMTGLDVAKYVFERELDTRVVILSGYKEFEYAQQALKYHVEDYILKPMHVEELEKVFRKIRKELDEAHKEQEQSVDYSAILPELQEQFWVNILLGVLQGEEQLLKKMRLLGLPMGIYVPCAVVDIRIKQGEESVKSEPVVYGSQNLLVNNIFMEQESLFSIHPVQLSGNRRKLVVLSNTATTKEEFGEKLQQYLLEKIEVVKSFLNLSMEASIEELCGSVSDLAEYYASRQIVPEEQQTEKCDIAKEDMERLQQKYHQMVETINIGDFDSMNQVMNNILFELYKLPLNEMKTLLIDMFSMIVQKILKMNPEIWTDVKGQVDYFEILRTDTRKELNEKCSDVLERITDIVKQRKSELSQNTIDRIMEYLKSHFDEDISLDFLAEKYYMSGSYLSRIFKQYTGNNLTDYLIELRMERAKSLLVLGKYKTYEISQMVGYKSDKYFYRVFKQYTGKSPSEYCRGNVE